MAEIRIDFYGHSCFKVAYEDVSAVFDPYENNNVPGLTLPAGITATNVYCSHEHGDHNARHLVNETAAEGDPFKAEFLTVPHDDKGGALRGMNKITILHAGTCKVVHMGDIGRLPLADEYEALRGTDVLMIPTGGHFTIDAKQAKEIVDTIRPKLTILMHFRKGAIGYGVIADFATVKESFPEVKELDESCISFDETAVPEAVIAMKPAQ